MVAVLFVKVILSAMKIEMLLKTPKALFVNETVESEIVEAMADRADFVPQSPLKEWLEREVSDMISPGELAAYIP